MHSLSHYFRLPAAAVPALLALAAAGAVPGASLAPRSETQPAPSREPSRAVINLAQARASYLQLPLAFESIPDANPIPARFRASGSGYSLLLTPTGATLALPSTPRPNARGHSEARQTPRHQLTPPPTIVRLQWRGANPHPHASGLEELPGKVRRYPGKDLRQWECDSALYRKVRYQGVYPGIDLIYYGSQRQIEYDWTVAPGADPRRIRLAVQGAQSVSLTGKGELLIHTADGSVRQPQPRLYQERAGRREAIAGGYVLLGKDQVGFQVGSYDPGRALVIDPTLVYASDLGGAGWDQGFGIAVDGAGSVYITGVSNLPTYWPTTRDAAQAQPTSASGGGAFVTKLDLTKPGAAALVYSTYLGSRTLGTGIAVDAAGNAYLAGFIFVNLAGALPITPGAFQPSSRSGNEDGFAAKLSPTGALVYATFLGGSANTEVHGIAVDGPGNAYLTGVTHSRDFPTTPNAFQPQFPAAADNHAFVTKLDPTGKPLYSTFLGGSQNDRGEAIAVDGAGNAYVTGDTFSPDFPTTATALQKQHSPSPSGIPAKDAFVTKLSPTGTPLYSTFLGGVGLNAGNAIAVDGAQDIYVTGRTLSTVFPVTPGAFQANHRGGGNANAFVARISAAGALIYSTYLGGSGDDQGNAIAVDAAGDAFVTGRTSSADFLVTPSGVQTALGRGPAGQLTSDAFLTVLEPGGKFAYYSTYLGGSGDDGAEGIVVDENLNIYLVGTTDSPDFRTIAGAVQSAFGGDQKGAHWTNYAKGGVELDRIQGDAFVAKIALKQ